VLRQFTAERAARLVGLRGRSQNAFTHAGFLLLGRQLIEGPNAPTRAGGLAQVAHPWYKLDTLDTPAYSCKGFLTRDMTVAGVARGIGRSEDPGRRSG
jgi:hypothetical protein